MAVSREWICTRIKRALAVPENEPEREYRPPLIVLLEWRYGPVVWKKILGFWVKAFLEGVVTVGVPLAVVFVLFPNGIAELLRSIDSVPNSPLFGWSVLTVLGWLSIRCYLREFLVLTDEPAALPTDGEEPEERVERDSRREAQ